MGNKKEMWKAPVKVWIRDMYEERKWKSERKKENKQAGKRAVEPVAAELKDLFD